MSTIDENVIDETGAESTTDTAPPKKNKRAKGSKEADDTGAESTTDTAPTERVVGFSGRLKVVAGTEIITTNKE